MMIVKQCEAGPNASNTGDYWYIVKGGNGETVLTSKMYRNRWRAIRAARAFIASVGTDVSFSYLKGSTPTHEAEAAALGKKPHGTLRHYTEWINPQGWTTNTGKTP